MRPISTTQLKPLHFTGIGSQKMKMQTNKIGWFHSLSDEPGAKFDIVIKDSQGRVRFEKSGFTSQTKQCGVLLNLPTTVGEELEISVSKIEGAKSLDLFVN